MQNPDLGTSIAAFEGDAENFFAETEAEVQAVVATIQKGVALATSGLTPALAWPMKARPLYRSLEFCLGGRSRIKPGSCRCNHGGADSRCGIESRRASARIYATVG